MGTPSETLCLDEGEPEDHYGYLIDLRGVRFADDESSWIQAIPHGTWEHPIHGKLEFTPETAQQFAANINSGVRGQDLDVDYDHKSQTGEAAGWVRSADARDDGLWLMVQWTKSAAAKIKEGAYRYFSPEFAKRWKHPQTGTTHQNVLFGGAVTNRPFLKGILPINLSDLSLDVPHPKEDEVDRQKLIEQLGLGTDATDEDVFTALSDLQTLAERQEEPEPEPDDDDDDRLPAALSEHPELAALFQAQQEQIRTLSEKVEDVVTDNRRKSAALKLQELGQGKFALPPKVAPEVLKLMAGEHEDPAAALVSVLETITTEGVVPLGEVPASRGPGSGRGTDSYDKWENGIRKLMEENEGMSYADAAIELAFQEPELEESVRRMDHEASAKGGRD